MFDRRTHIDSTDVPAVVRQFRYYNILKVLGTLQGIATKLSRCIIEKYYLSIFLLVRFIVMMPVGHQFTQLTFVLHVHRRQYVKALLVVAFIQLARNYPVDVSIIVECDIQRQRIHHVTIECAILQVAQSVEVRCFVFLFNGSSVEHTCSFFLGDALIDGRAIVGNIAMNILDVEIGVEAIVRLLYLLIKNTDGEHNRRKVTRHSRYIGIAKDVYIIET